MVDQSPSGVLVRLPNWYNPPGRSQQWWDIHGQFSWMININVHWFWYLTTKIWCQTCIRGSAYSCKRAEVKQHKWLTKTTPSVSYEQLNSQSYSKFKAWSKRSHNHVAYVFLDLQVAASFSLWALKYLPDTGPDNHALSSVTHAWKLAASRAGAICNVQRIEARLGNKPKAWMSPSWNNMNKHNAAMHGIFDSWFWEFLQVKWSREEGYSPPLSRIYLRAKITQRSWAGAASIL